MDELKENVIEWVTGDKYIACTFTQKKYISKVRKIALQMPELVPIFHENDDGSIFCRLPIKALKLSVITRKGAGFGKEENLN